MRVQVIDASEGFITPPSGIPSIDAMPKVSSDAYDGVVDKTPGALRKSGMCLCVCMYSKYVCLRVVEACRKEEAASPFVNFSVFLTFLILSCSISPPLPVSLQ